MNRTVPILILPVLLAIRAPSLSAQAHEDEGIHTHNWTVVQEDEGGRSLRLEDHDGKLQVIINGEEIPGDRIRRQDGGVTVLDEEGNTILVWPPRGERRASLDLPARSEPLGFASLQPRKRIGVTLGEVDEALAAWSGVDLEACCLVTSVVAGGPADEAGMQRWDILVGIEGRDQATADDLREAVAETPEGESLHLRVLRKGKELGIVVQPRVMKDEEADSEVERWLGGLSYARPEGSEARQELERAIHALEEARKRIEDGRLLELQERLRKEWDKLPPELRDLEEKLRGAYEEALDLGRSRLEDALKDLRERDPLPYLRDYGYFLDRGRRDFFLTPPTLQAPRLRGHALPGPESDGRLKAVEERLDQVAKRLARIEELLLHRDR